DDGPSPEGLCGSPCGALCGGEGEAVSRARQHVTPAPGDRRLGARQSGDDTRVARRVDAVQITDVRERHVADVLEDMSRARHGHGHAPGVGDLLVADEFWTRKTPAAVAAPSELNVIVGPKVIREAFSRRLQPEPSVSAPVKTWPPGHGTTVPEQNRIWLFGFVCVSTLYETPRVT